MTRQASSTAGRLGWTLAVVILLGLPTLTQARADTQEQPEPKEHRRPVDRTPPREPVAAPAPAPSAAPARPATTGSTAVRRGGGDGADRPARTPAPSRVREPERTARGRSGEASDPSPDVEPARNRDTLVTAGSGSTGASRSTGQQPRQRYPSGTYSGVAVPRHERPPAHGPGWGWWDPGNYRPNYWYWAPWSWGLGSFVYYDPFWWNTSAPYSYYGAAAAQYPPTGSVRLKVKPRDAQVFVDGYYAGIVDEFDGNFQSLKLVEGPHRIEVRRDGLQPLEFNVYVLADRTLKLTGTLQP